jgi:hypothetical protein
VRSDVTGISNQADSGGRNYFSLAKGKALYYFAVMTAGQEA